MNVLRRGITALLGVAMLAGCLDSATGPEDFSAVSWVGNTFFLSQPRVPNAFMQALFHGAVLRDELGCLRLQPPSSATVIWPHGAALEERDGDQWVLESSGGDIGLVGGIFRFGGGEVPALHDGMGFSRAQVRAIEARCPGRYWIVGEILHR